MNINKMEHDDSLFDQEQNVSMEMNADEPQKDVKRRKIRVQFDIEYNGHPGTSPGGEKLTVPDLSLTIHQLLENHSRGINDKTQVRQPLYFGTEIPTINDLTDVERFRDHLAERLQHVKDFIKNEKQEENGNTPGNNQGDPDSDSDNPSVGSQTDQKTTNDPS